MCNKRLKNVFQPNFSVTEKKFTNFLVPPVNAIDNAIMYMLSGYAIKKCYRVCYRVYVT